MTDQNTHIKGVLFDLDGVLINSLAVMKMALGAALKEVYPKRNFDLDSLFTQYQKYLGMGFGQIMNELNLSSAVHEPFRKHSRYLAPYIYLYPGVHELLQHCQRQQFKMGIATGKDFARTEEILAQLRIRPYFSQILASDTVDHAKPAPDMAVQFCEQQNLAAQDVLMLGDAEADIRCGKAAGCITAAAAWGYGDFDNLWAMSPDYCFNSPDDAIVQLTTLTDAKEA